jgi:hypothetical protein
LVLFVTLGVVDLLKKMYELMGWEELVTTICGHATAECQKQVELFYIDGRMLLIKIFSRIDIKMLLLNHLVVRKDLTYMTMIESGEIDLVIIDSDSSLIQKQLDGV